MGIGALEVDKQSQLDNRLEITPAGNPLVV
jgi:hypothetical protein